jgi:hypothetical protein
MRARRSGLVFLGVALVGGAALVWLPEVARWVTLAQIHALTWRPVSIEAVELNLLTADSRFAGSVSPSMTERSCSPTSSRLRAGSSPALVC